MNNGKIEKMIVKWRLRKNECEERLISAQHNGHFEESLILIGEIHLCDMAIIDLIDSMGSDR